MRLVTYTQAGSARSRLGVLVGEQVLDLEAAASALIRKGPYGSVLELLQAGRGSVEEAADLVDRAMRRARSAGEAPWLVPSSQVSLLPPLVPGKLICIGKNYAEHAAEGGNKPNEAPTGFVKCSSTLVGDGAVVPYPSFTKQLDYEVELAVVIGRPAKNVPPERALEYVVGYTILNDISARDWQNAERKRGNHLLGKNFDGSGPLGPALVTADEISDPQNLEMWLRVNGVVRQHANTSGMVYDIPTQIAHWSRMTLHPGDILSTGTPAGCALGYKEDSAPWLVPGDQIEAEIEGLGVLHTRIDPPA